MRLELICQETCCRRVGNMPEIMAALRPSTNPSAEPMVVPENRSIHIGCISECSHCSSAAPLMIIKNEVGFQLSRTVVHEQA